MTIDTNALPIKTEFVAKTKRGDWECFEWRVTISGKSGYWSTPYYCGLAHVVKPSRFHEPRPKKPTNDDILHSLTLDASAEQENFHDWCENYGESDDSIKALNTYKQCLEIGANLRKYLGREVVSQLTEQLRDH